MLRGYPPFTRVRQQVFVWNRRSIGLSDAAVCQLELQAAERIQVMAIKYQLRPDLTKEHREKGIMIVRGSTALRVDQEVLIEEIIRQGTTVRRADVEAVLSNLGAALVALCSRGESVTVPGRPWHYHTACAWNDEC